MKIPHYFVELRKNCVINRFAKFDYDWSERKTLFIFPWGRTISINPKMQPEMLVNIEELFIRSFGAMGDGLLDSKPAHRSKSWLAEIFEELEQNP